MELRRDLGVGNQPVLETLQVPEATSVRAGHLGVAGAEQLQCRNELDVVTRGQVRVLVDVHLDECDLAGKVACRLLEQRGEAVAGTTPGGVEVDDDRSCALADEIIELSRALDLDDGSLALSGGNGLSESRLIDEVRGDKAYDSRHRQNW